MFGITWASENEWTVSSNGFYIHFQNKVKTRKLSTILKSKIKADSTTVIMMVLLDMMRSKPTQASAMVDKCTLFTSHTYICIYSYKIQNIVDCHPDNDWATIPCLLLAPWLAYWLAVFCSLTNMMQDPIAAVGTCQIWKKKKWFPCTFLGSQHHKTEQQCFPTLRQQGSGGNFTYGLWFVIQGVLRLGGMPYAHKKIIKHVGMFPLLKLVQHICHYYLSTPYQGTDKKRQRKRHHPLDRLRNESGMFIICDLTL